MKKLFPDEDSARKSLRKSYEGLKVLGEIVKGPGSFEKSSEAYFDPIILNAIGSSLVQHILNIAETFLYLVCCKHAVPNGTLDYPRLKDLSAKGNAVNASPDAKLAADSMDKIRNNLKKETLNPEVLSQLLYAFRIFLRWTLKELSGNKLEEEIIRELLDFVENGYLYYDSKKDEIDKNTRSYNDHYQEYG